MSIKNEGAFFTYAVVEDIFGPWFKVAKEHFELEVVVSRQKNPCRGYFHTLDRSFD